MSSSQFEDEGRARIWSTVVCSWKTFSHMKILHQSLSEPRQQPANSGSLNKHVLMMIMMMMMYGLRQKAQLCSILNRIVILVNVFCVKSLLKFTFGVKNYYFARGSGCKVLWWASVCVSVFQQDISGTPRVIFTKYFVYVAYVHGSVLLACSW